MFVYQEQSIGGRRGFHRSRQEYLKWVLENFIKAYTGLVWQSRNSDNWCYNEVAPSCCSIWNVLFAYEIYWTPGRILEKYFFIITSLGEIVLASEKQRFLLRLFLSVFLQRKFHKAAFITGSIQHNLSPQG